MITLGLKNIIAKQRGPTLEGLQGLSEVAKRLEMSSEVKQTLSETVAWCLNRSVHSNNFRSSELDPSTVLKIRPFDELGIDMWLKEKRESYQLAISAINANRSTLVRDRCIEVADPAVTGSKGRLLLYEPLENVADGASEFSSQGFFDIEDAPPWDTCFAYIKGSIVSWVPEAVVNQVQAGIDANPVDCIHWCDWQRF